MLDKFTFTAYAFRILKDDPKVFDDFDRLLIHRVMTQGDALMTEAEMDKFDELTERAYKHLIRNKE
jgi:hypothetical protein